MTTVNSTNTVMVTGKIKLGEPILKIDPEKITLKWASFKKVIGLETKEEKPMVGRIKCKVPMVLDHFHDFYFLQALQANIGMKIAANPELQFKKSIEKLKEDVDAAIEEIVPNIALRVFVYLYAACLGEARHARETTAKSRWIPVTQQRERSEIYMMIADFAPSKQNINALVDIFDQDWLSGYGGQAWKRIAQALHLYYDGTAASFIDHVIDLEHNGGTVFNKSDAKYAIQFRTEYSSGRFKHFLDYKFKYNILEKSFSNEWGGALWITKPVAKLLERYATIFETKPITWARPMLASLDKYQITWGEKVIVVEDKWAQGADVSKGNAPQAHSLMSAMGVYEIYPASFTVKELKALLVRKKAKAVKMAGKYMTKDLDKKLDQTIKTYLKQASPQCKIPKMKVTFPVLPCKVAWTAYGLKLCVPVKCGKIGSKTDYGFEYTTEGHMGIHPSSIKGSVKNYIDDGGLYEDGHLSMEYGQLNLHVKSGNWKLNAKKLEALLE